MQALCAVDAPQAVAAVKPHLQGLLQGGLLATQGGAPPLAADAWWLAPAAALLAPETKLPAYHGAYAANAAAADAAGAHNGSPACEKGGGKGGGKRGKKGRGGRRRSAGDKENAAINCEPAEPDAASKAAGADAEARTEPGTRPAATDAAAIKALLQAAGLAKVGFPYIADQKIEVFLFDMPSTLLGVRSRALR